MTSTIEYLGKPVLLIPAVQTDRFDCLPVGTSIDICAWCDSNKVITNELLRMGYKTNHGICAKHEAEVLKDYKESKL